MAIIFLTDVGLGSLSSKYPLRIIGTFKLFSLNFNTKFSSIISKKSKDIFHWFTLRQFSR